MRSKVASPQVRLQPEGSRAAHKPKREFLVEEHRKEFDDYMLAQVKKNRKSVKRIKKTVEQLRLQVDELRDQNKKQRGDYEQLNSQLRSLRRQMSEPRLELTARRSPKPSVLGSCLHKTRKQFVASKESSFSVRSSGVEAPRGKSAGSKAQGRPENTSKTMLKRKIEDLKEKAHLIRQNAQQLQEEIHRKIERKLENSPSKHLHDEEEENAKAYQELMELLKTNKRIQQSIPNIQQAQPIQSKQNISITEEVPAPNYSDKSMLSTNRDPTPLKNSAVATYYADPKPPSPLQSQTNLLDSDKNITVKPKPTLRVSRCVEVQVVAETQEEGEFSGLLRECKASGSELSFEGPDSEQHLKELQFEFDQLVRQELMSNEPKEKEALARSIRCLLERITQLRQQLQQSH